MARDLFRAEKGLELLDENGSSGASLLFGSAAPGGDAAEQDAASQGSLYMRTSGAVYQKKTAGSGADKWEQLLAPSVVSWREERVIVATNDTITAGSRNLSTTPFSDDEGTTIAAGDFSVGEYAIGDVDGTPALFEVTAISAPSVTFAAASTALSDGDTFVVENYLPDSPDAQERQAIVLYSGTSIIKLSDFNWEIATGIYLSSGYAASGGDPASSDSVEVAIAKLDDNLDDLTAAVGVSQGDQNMGTYTGTIITDNQSAKQNIQELETDVDDIQTLTGVAAESTDLGTFTGNIITDNSTIKTALQELETFTETIQTKTSSNAITTAVTLDQVLVDDYSAAKWFVTLWLDSAPERRISLEVYATHDGVIAPGTPADAANVDDTVYAKVKTGATFNHSVAVDISGTGASQYMRLRISASTAISARATRMTVDF